MSIALESNSNSRIGMSCVSIYDSSESVADDCRFLVGNTTMNRVVKEEEEEEEDSDSCSSSSIGRNSDTSAGEVDSGDCEVQSSYKGPLNALDVLEEVLPIKRGISNFYCGKSKSFTSLGDASSCSSITDISKPENSYTRKRKNLIAFNAYFDKNHSNCLTSSNNYIGGSGPSGNRGISKRPANSTSTLALAMIMGSSESTDNSESSNSDSSSPNRCLPPLHPHTRRPTTTNTESLSSPPRHKTSPWRSFSLSDLQGASAAIPSLVTANRDDEG